MIAWTEDVENYSVLAYHSSTQCYAHTHTYEQFLQITARLDLGLILCFASF